MISPETLRRYPFFAGLNTRQLDLLAMAGQDLSVDAGYAFFEPGDTLHELYLVTRGEVAIEIGVPDRSAALDVRDHILGSIPSTQVTVSSVCPGDLFGWSALIPPHESTAGAVAVTACQAMAIDCRQLRHAFDTDCEFAQAMLLKAATVVRHRLRDMHVQSLYFVAA